MSSDDKQGRDSTVTDITYDSMGIPILDEVVDSASSELPPPISQASGSGLNLPRHELLLSALRQQLKAELQADLTRMIDQVAVTIASEVSLKLKQQIRAQLSETMDHRLSTILDNALNEHADKWNV